jgi:2-C-methyl-D-erythritol 4-phosphate cytidylyltransferase/2-C-methyl-D-erythritol 2,4-cyclodiphosphate synthase
VAAAQVLQCKKGELRASPAQAFKKSNLYRRGIALHRAGHSIGAASDMAGMIAAVVVAGGRGLRAGGDVPKQYREILGEPVIRPSLKAFAEHPGVQAVQPVIHPDDTGLFAAATAGLALLAPVAGAATRQGSVRAGLEGLAANAPEIVLVHDAARPFVSPAVIDRAIAAARQAGAAVPVIPVADTVKTVDAAGMVTGTVDRAPLRLVQTPQAFAFAPLLAAHRRAQAEGRDDFTDDAALAEWAGLNVATFAGEAGNVKLTTNDDFVRAEAAKLAALGDVRTGFGFDVHQFADGDHVMLGGVRVAHPRGLSGHSDADVVLHALVDAILGALSEGDIGVHFPPSDPQWRGASSDRFFAFAVERVRARGGRIAHLDVTVVCEAPRIGPHRDAIRARIAELAGLPLRRVAVKATTSEKMGFTGRGEGMVAFANATVRLPWSD